jgi:rhodanese-related sulfurtransferase
MGYSDVSVLDGGTRTWAAAGYRLYAGVNVPSKLLGELVEQACRTPRVSAAQLQRMKDSGENIVVLDGRPYGEYRKTNIPGAVCCPNAELPYRVPTMVRDPATTIVVNCAGRTRSIIGAQTLIDFGIANRVYALEDGTQGWVLADLQLEHGAARIYPERIEADLLPALQRAARALASRFAVPWVGAGDVKGWFQDPGRTTYLCDVRTAEEFEAGSIAGALHAPGGQLIQATDQWIGVRNARIVVFDAEDVRAPVVAAWLRQLGCDAYALEGGIRPDLAAPLPVRHALPAVAALSAAELKARLDADACSVLDLRPSMQYRRAHVPGSRWSTRIHIARDVRNARLPVVLIADEGDIAGACAIDLAEAGIADVTALAGGWASWEAAGYPVDSSPDVPADADCIDYLWFVHDRHAGNRAAMREYLAWEKGLSSRLDDQERSVFRVVRT